jgi:hypothetical protein
MPWRQKPMKDVGGCDKPRGAANRAFDPRMSEWGNLAIMRAWWLRRSECIGPCGVTRGTETSQYPEEKKTTVILRVAASEMGGA